MTNDLQVQANKSIESSSSDQQIANHEPTAHLVPNGQDHQMKGYVHEHDQALVPVYAQAPLAIQPPMFHVNGSHIPMGMYEHPSHYPMSVEGQLILSPQQAAPIDYNNNPQPWQTYSAYPPNIEYTNGIYQPGPVAAGTYPAQFVAFYPPLTIPAPADPNLSNGTDGHSLAGGHLQPQPQQSQQAQPSQGSYARHPNGKANSAKPFRASPAASKYSSQQQQSSSFSNRNQNPSSNGANSYNERGVNANAKSHDPSYRPARLQRPSKTHQQLNNNSKAPKETPPPPQPQIDLNSNDFPVVSANPRAAENLAEASKPTIPGGRSYSSVVSTNLSESSATNSEATVSSNSASTPMKAPEAQQPQQPESQLRDSNASEESEATETTYEKADRNMLARGSASKPKQKYIKNGKLGNKQRAYCFTSSHILFFL